MVRFKDVENGGETMFNLPVDFTDKITSIHYNKEKNVLFIASKNGKLRIWKVPKELRNKDIEKVEREYEFSRKQILKIKE